MARHHELHLSGVRLLALLGPLGLLSCGGGGGGVGGSDSATSQTISCMLCHNGSQHNDYAGPGIEDPHPFPNASNIACVTCHGGNGGGGDKDSSHVPPPPQIGDRTKQITDQHAWFNKLTLAGMDKFADYSVNGMTYTALQYLQFLNPGDVRVAAVGRGCGQCHANHSNTVSRSVLATEAGFFSGSTYFIGADNAIAGRQGMYDDTAADYGFRAVTDPNYVFDPVNNVGAVQSLIEVPVKSTFNRSGAMEIFRNASFDAPNIAADVLPDNRVVTGSRLQYLFMEQVNFTCGDCHLGHQGANNRYGDFRSSGCTACHMPYSLDGKSRSLDLNVNKTEPVDPDDIDPPERAHVKAHRIRSVYKVMSNGVTQQGIEDVTCAGCHQGSNRTVMQFWGIRLDQNQDLRNNFQYPANPVTWKNTAGDTRLFDPVVRNNTFNGRNANQYILREDYDGDTRDDTPPDCHYEAGMGCIDCHNSNDVHGGDTKLANQTRIASRFDEQLAIECKNCHGVANAYATTQQGIAFDGTVSNLAVDERGNLMTHVRKEGDGNYYLYGRLDGAKHFIKQTYDVVVDHAVNDPFSGLPVYNGIASYAMGRADGDPIGNGIGPLQLNTPPTGFSHGDNMSCASCHSSWSNTCVGCHLKLEYNEGNNYSNITGDRIVVRQRNADFTYQTVVPFQLGVDPKNRISVMSTNTKVFFQWRDRLGNFTKIFAFTDRNSGGNNPADGFPALGHNTLLQHSIRGKVTSTKEGPRYCVACHLTEDALANFGTEYDTFRAAMAIDDFASLDFNLLKTHIGKNSGNQLNSPLWVHMVAGLGSGVFLFDQFGGPMNTLDNNANRFGANGVAPSAKWDPTDVVFNLDRVVDETGLSKSSNNHPMLHPGTGPALRDGSADPQRPGPLGATLIQRLTDPVNGIVLDSWFDANGAAQGNAAGFVPGT